MDDYNKKSLIKELARFDLCSKKVIPEDKIAKYKKDENNYIQNNMYLCEIDEDTNTRILLNIFKCLNTIKSILIAGVVCFAIAVFIMILK